MKRWRMVRMEKRCYKAESGRVCRDTKGQLIDYCMEPRKDRLYLGEATCHAEVNTLAETANQLSCRWVQPIQDSSLGEKVEVTKKRQLVVGQSHRPWKGKIKDMPSLKEIPGLEGAPNYEEVLGLVEDRHTWWKCMA